jgi:translation initiation factor IF-3
MEALRLAEEANVDLVEIAPLANPPVCKLMDYGKFRYREQKKEHEAKRKQKQIQVKEIKFRPGTDEGDYKIKLQKLIDFLDEGDKAKVTLRFRGREMAHKEFGERLLDRVRKDLDAHGVVEQFPKLEGRQMVMVLAPKRKTAAAAAVKEKPAGKDKPEAGAAKPKAEPKKAPSAKPAAA